MHEGRYPCSCLYGNKKCCLRSFFRETLWGGSLHSDRHPFLPPKILTNRRGPTWETFAFLVGNAANLKKKMLPFLQQTEGPAPHLFNGRPSIVLGVSCTLKEDGCKRSDGPIYRRCACSRGDGPLLP